MPHQYAKQLITIECEDCGFKITFPFHNFDPGAADLLIHHCDKYLKDWRAHSDNQTARSHL